jgi:probable F420-dependent oxidoreductase
MQFGVGLRHYGRNLDWGKILETAIVAEELGFRDVWTTDHVIVPKEDINLHGSILEPLVVLSSIATRTEKIRLGTSVVVLPQRNPILLAKQVATLDHISKGRVILGVGSGWSEKEFSYLGADFARRGRILDESIRLLRELWSGRKVTNFSGVFFTIKEGVFAPKPVRQIPIWIGGASTRAINRAAEIGDGWLPIGLAPERLAQGIQLIRKRRRNVTISLKLNVDFHTGTSSTTTPTGERHFVLNGARKEMIARLEEYEKTGLDHLQVAFLSETSGGIIVDMRKFRKDILNSFE